MFFISFPSIFLNSFSPLFQRINHSHLYNYLVKFVSSDKILGTYLFLYYIFKNVSLYFNFNWIVLEFLYSYMWTNINTKFSNEFQAILAIKSFLLESYELILQVFLFNWLVLFYSNYFEFYRLVCIINPFCYEFLREYWT